MPAHPLNHDPGQWRARFRTPSIRSVQYAASNPYRALVTVSSGEAYQLHAWSLDTGAMVPLAVPRERQSDCWLSPDGRHVYYLRDDRGNDTGHYVRVPFAGGEAEDITPEMPAYCSFGVLFSRSAGLCGFAHADEAGTHVRVVELGPDGAVGRSRVIYEGQGMIAGPWLSSDGQVAMVFTNERAHGPVFGMVAVEVASGRRIAEMPGGEDGSFWPPVSFSPLPGDSRFLTASDASGRRRPILWDPICGRLTTLEIGDLEGDVLGSDWAADGERILLCQSCQAVQRYYLYDLEQRRLWHLDHPHGTGSMCFGPEGEILALWEDATHPPEVIALAGDTGACLRTVLAAGVAPPGRPFSSVTLASSDGQPVQAWLALPGGAGPFPAVIDLHGGPRTTAWDQFNPQAQAWLDHGFAYMSVNYRGSSGFGRRFEDQILGDVGHWELEDVVAARKWLVSHGIADPSRILLTGWSYGGFLTLLALGRYPHLWAAGMAGTAIADWTLTYEDTTSSAQELTAAFLGGTPEERRELYRSRSPIAYADRIEAPVLVIHGRHDTHATTRQMEKFAARMKDLGKDIEAVWFESGHSGPFSDLEEDIRHQEIMLRFACRVLQRKQ